MLIVTISLTIALATVMSAVGICDRCHVRHGGVYFIVSHVLGGKIGGSVGLLYCLGHVSYTAINLFHSIEYKKICVQEHLLALTT